MKTGKSIASTLTRTRGRRTKARATGLALGLAATAAVALGASPAQAAECSDGAEAILGLSEIAAGFIPKVGDVAAAGIAIGSTLVCDEQSPLDAEDVLGLIRTELDEQAADAATEDLENAQDDLDLIATDLQGISGDFENIDLITATFLHFEIEQAENRLTDAVDDFKVPLTTHNNERAGYDMSAAILLTNYKLTLLQLSAAIPFGDEQFIAQTADNILEDVAAFRTESDRLRDIVRVINYKFGENRYIGRMERDGVKFGQGFARDGHAEVHVDAIRFSLTREMAAFYRELDAQDARFEIIEARAKALVDDPFVSLSTVPRTAPVVSVLLRNDSDNAQGDRCLANPNGRLREDGPQPGVTRVRNCDPTLSHHQWLLRDDGLIQTRIADLCLAAKPDKKVLVEACAPEDAAQIWTRVGDRFRVEIEGVQTCLTPGKGGLNNDSVVARHISCDDAVDHQRWLAFSPLQSGRPLQLPAPSADALSSEDVLALADQVQEAVSGGLCVDGELLEELALFPCDRYDETQLWAQGADGHLQGLRRTGPATIGTSPDDSSQLVFVDAPSQEGSVAVVFERTNAADGSATFARQDSGDIMFPGAPESGASLFLDSPLIDEAGELEDFVFWQHSNGGKFAP